MDHRALVNVVAFVVGFVCMVAVGVATAAAPTTWYEVSGLGGDTWLRSKPSVMACIGLKAESLDELNASFYGCLPSSEVRDGYGLTYTKGDSDQCSLLGYTCRVHFTSPPEPTAYVTGNITERQLCWDGAEPVGGVCPESPTCTAGERMDFSVPGSTLVPLCRDGCRWENSGVGVCVAGACFSEYTSTGGACTVGPSGNPLSDGSEWVDSPVTETTTTQPAPVTDGDTVTEQQTVTTQTDDSVKLDTVNNQTTITETSVHGVKKTTTTTTTTHADGSQTITETVSYQQTTPDVTMTRIGSGGSVTTQPGETVSGSRTTTSLVGADGSVTSTTTETGVGGDGEGGPEDEGGECGILPQVVCDWFEEPELDPTPIEVPTIESTPGDYDSGLPSSGGCPAGFTVNLGAFGSPTVSLQPLCDLASAIRPMVIAIAYLLAAFIVVGGRGK